MADPATDPLAPAPPTTPTSLMSKAQGFADANKVTPLSNTFDESKSTAGRVASITDENSPLMQRAAVSGTQVAAARGLTNSSLAAEASQNAVLDKATAIATNDANLYGQNSIANLAAKNQAALANASNATTIGNTALSGENQAAIQNKVLEQNQRQFDVNSSQDQQRINIQKEQFGQSLENQKAIAQMSQSTQLQVAKLQAENQAQIQGNSTIGAAWSATMSNIANIQNNPNLEEAAKRTLIQNNIDSFQSYATFWKGVQGAVTPDISALLQFNTGNAATPSAPGTPGAAPAQPWTPYPPGVNPGGGPMDELRGG